MKVWIWICSPLTFSTTILSAIGPFTPTSLGIKGAPSPRQGCTLGGRPHAPSQHGARADMFRGIRPDIGRETRFLTFDSISRGGVFSQATLRDIANCSREVSSSNQLSATFLEMHLLQMSKDLNSWDLTASPGYWPLITSWWKFKMLSSPINFHCFTGSEKSVDSHLSMSIGESAKEVTFLQMCWGWRGGGRGGVKIHL